jgi:hypothetical protein
MSEIGALPEWLEIAAIGKNLPFKVRPNVGHSQHSSLSAEADI